MNPVLNVLLKVFVREFYKVHASLFLLVIGLAGGFMRSVDHLALAEFFINSPFLLSIPVLIWLLYALKVINFNQVTLIRKENEFLYQAILLPGKDRWGNMLVASAYQLVPVYLYATFLLVLALKHGLYSICGWIILSVVLLQILIPFKLLNDLQHPNRGMKVSRLRKLLNIVFVKPYPWFLVEWIVRRQLLTLAGFKIFSFFILYGTIQLYNGETYDVRLLGMAIAVAMAAHASMVCEIHRFENFHFAMIRQLPLSFTKRLMFLLMAMTLLTIPETALLARSFPSSLEPSSLAGCYLFAMSVLLLLYNALYLKDRNEEQFMPIVFGCAMSWIVLILFKIPLWLLGGTNVLIGLLIWRRYYYSFEYISQD